MANETALAQELLEDTWGPMVRRDANYTGAFWEYLVSLFLQLLTKIFRENDLQD